VGGMGTSMGLQVRTGIKRLVSGLWGGNRLKSAQKTTRGVSYFVGRDRGWQSRTPTVGGTEGRATGGGRGPNKVEWKVGEERLFGKKNRGHTKENNGNSSEKHFEGQGLWGRRARYMLYPVQGLELAKGEPIVFGIKDKQKKDINVEICRGIK